MRRSSAKARFKPIKNGFPTGCDGGGGGCCLMWVFVVKYFLFSETALAVYPPLWLSGMGLVGLGWRIRKKRKWGP